MLLGILTTFHDLGGKFVSKAWCLANGGPDRWNMRNEALTPATVNDKFLGDVGLCNGTTQGFTLVNNKYITMCDSAFKQGNLMDMWREQESWPKGKNINELRTAGADFQHEMMHYIDEGSKLIATSEGTEGN